MVEFWAYGDDSGTQNDAKYCLLLGFLGSPRQWSSFNNAWAAVIKDSGAPEFHAIDFFQGNRRNKSSKNPFRDWDEAKRQVLLDNLLKIILSHQVVPIGWAVDVLAFEALSHEERRYLTGARLVSHQQIRRISGDIDKDFGQPTLRRWFVNSGAPNRPYLVAFHLFLQDAVNLCPEDSKLNLVLDRQGSLESYAIGNFQQLAKQWNDEDARREALSGPMPRKQLSLIAYANSIDKPAIQAADLYAYSWGSYLNDTMNPQLEHAKIMLAKKKAFLQIATMAHFESALTQLREALEEEAVFLTDVPSDDLETRL